jgi:hypothetical protein
VKHVRPIAARRLKMISFPNVLINTTSSIRFASAVYLQYYVLYRNENMKFHTEMYGFVSGNTIANGRDVMQYGRGIPTFRRDLLTPPPTPWKRTKCLELGPPKSFETITLIC